MTSSEYQILPLSAGKISTPPLAISQQIAITEIDGEWKASVKQRLEELIRLEEGWDGYVAFPVSFETAVFALRMLESICGPNTPAPQIVPGLTRDIQIEWHTHHGDIELWVQSPNNVHA